MWVGVSIPRAAGCLEVRTSDKAYRGERSLAERARASVDIAGRSAESVDIAERGKGGVAVTPPHECKRGR